MARKSDLRKQRTDTVINETSKVQEKALQSAVRRVVRFLEKEFPGIRVSHSATWKLKDVVKTLRDNFPDQEFFHYFDASSMRPDGGILFVTGSDNIPRPVLISEKKNQGTNDLRALEGKPKQAKGNAIERLGKNVIGFRTALKNESIFPFVCFGDGCDFADNSSILDRVVTIAQFGRLNKMCLHNDGLFDRGTFLFRVHEWTEEEMYKTCKEIACRSVLYYYSKYGQNTFVRT